MLESFRTAGRAARQTFSFAGGWHDHRAVHETIQAHLRSRPETEKGVSCRHQTRGCTMLVLMNLIWRRLAYTMLIGMRSRLVRH